MPGLHAALGEQLVGPQLIRWPETPEIFLRLTHNSQRRFRYNAARRSRRSRDHPYPRRFVCLIHVSYRRITYSTLILASNWEFWSRYYAARISGFLSPRRASPRLLPDPGPARSLCPRGSTTQFSHTARGAAHMPPLLCTRKVKGRHPLARDTLSHAYNLGVTASGRELDGPTGHQDPDAG